MSYKQFARILGKHKKDLCEQYKVKEIGIFGSFVRGEQKKRSDVDILVDFAESPDFLEEILNKKVDLVRKPVIRKELRDQVLSEVIYV